MALMTACLGRLGSRYSIIFDPVRQEVSYGALGLKSQAVGEFFIGLDDGNGLFETLPLCKSPDRFTMVDQYQTMTSIVYEAFSERHGAVLQVEFISPFWPQDEKTSLVPCYIVNFKLTKLVRVRARLCEKAQRYGILRFDLNVGQAEQIAKEGSFFFNYPVCVPGKVSETEDGFVVRKKGNERTLPTNGNSRDRLVGLEGNWLSSQKGLEVKFDLRDCDEQCFSAAIMCYCEDALFERRGEGRRLKYTQFWGSADEVCDYVRSNWRNLLKKSVEFNRLIDNSQLPVACNKLIGYSFQSYLMNTLWAVSSEGQDWFSVWEGNCLYNSTIDVTFNEAMFYFNFWPQLLEMIFNEWAEHSNDCNAEKQRLASVPRNYAIKSLDCRELEYPGKILEHDMGAGWTANGQSYPHAMPVEENANFLILLYAHCCWWGNSELFERYKELCKDVVEYLLWADSTGSGFADMGRANTFDDGSPAVQYGHDNVYLGIKRMAALHCAMRIFEFVGEDELAAKCVKEVKKAVKYLHSGFLGDHFAVVMERSAKGIRHCITGELLDYEELPGWDDYSIFTSNGLLYLMMIDDLPAGLNMNMIKQDIMSATAATITRYGSSHSGKDNYRSVWISANLWRDCIAGYLGENMLSMCERYWDLQLFSNALGSDKTNCFTECVGNNNLIYYPRGVASLGLFLSSFGIRINRLKGIESIKPICGNNCPIFPLSNWRENRIFHFFKTDESDIMSGSITRNNFSKKYSKELVVV